MADDGTINLKDMGGAGAGQTGAAATQKDDKLAKYNIPEEVKQKYPELIALVVDTESMTEEERAYWFQILPIMTQQQVDKLRKILVQEKEQLAKLDTEYNKELEKLNEKHMIEWREFETKKVREERQEAEAAHEEKETQAEEELLKKLDDV